MKEFAPKGNTTVTSPYLTFPDVAHFFNSRINRRFENACRKNGQHTFFEHENIIYAIREHDYVISAVETQKSLAELLRVRRGHRLERNTDVESIHPLLPSHGELFKVSDPDERTVRPHAVDRLKERLPVTRRMSTEGAQGYIITSVKAGLASGDFFTVEDGSIMVLHKQMVYVVRTVPHTSLLAVYTSMRRNKLHLYALELFKSKKVSEVPIWLVSKAAIDAVL